MLEIDLWEKYHYETKQTICVIGVLILATKLCQADGHFSEREENEILSIIPHEPGQRNTLKKIILEASNDRNPITHHALNLKKLLKDDQPDFLEFIIAVLYRLAHSDNLYSQDEDDDIREVAKIFDIQKSISEKIIEFFVKNFNKIKISIFRKEKANA